MRKILPMLAVTLTVLLLCCSALAHSGRTDSRGGHKDNKNESGLGPYHYHCGGHPAHLHKNGVCPYADSRPKKSGSSSGSSFGSSSRSTPTPTPKPTAKPTVKPTYSSRKDQIVTLPAPKKDEAKEDDSDSGNDTLDIIALFGAIIGTPIAVGLVSVRRQIKEQKIEQEILIEKYRNRRK